MVKNIGESYEEVSVYDYDEVRIGVRNRRADDEVEPQLENKPNPAAAVFAIKLSFWLGVLIVALGIAQWSVVAALVWAGSWLMLVAVVAAIPLGNKKN